jgi:hypothetical protein
LLAYPQSETQASDPKQQRQLPSSYWSMPINSLGIYYTMMIYGEHFKDSIKVDTFYKFLLEKANLYF